MERCLEIIDVGKQFSVAWLDWPWSHILGRSPKNFGDADGVPPFGMRDVAYLLETHLSTSCYCAKFARSSNCMGLGMSEISETLAPRPAPFYYDGGVADP